MKTEYEELLEKEQFQLEKDGRLGKKTREFLEAAKAIMCILGAGAIAYGILLAPAAILDASPFLSDALQKIMRADTAAMLWMLVWPFVSIVSIWGLMALWCLSVGDDIPRFCFLPEKEEPQAR